MPRKIVVADMETDPFKYGRFPEPFLIGVYDGDEYWQFDTVHEFMSFIICKEWIVYAHNGGKFDWHFILDYLSLDQPIKIIGGRIAKFTIVECEFRDSFNILPVPLAAYQKDTIDYDIFEKGMRGDPKNRAEIEKYLKADCVYLYELVSDFVNEYGNHLTQATASLKYWQKLTGEKPPKSDKEYYDTFYPFYYGGRVECFTQGIIKDDFIMFDINSAYPRAMIENHPFSTTYSIETDVDLSYLNEPYDHKFFEIIAISKGALPKRLKDGKIVFPRNEMPTIYHCTGHELRAGLETKTLQLFDIRMVYDHDGLINFDEYVYHFYNLRLAAKIEIKRYKEGTPEFNECTRRILFYKLFLNSLYGKWAANPENYATYWIAGNEEAIRSFDSTDGPRHAGTMGTHTANHLMCKDLSDEEQRFYNVATAASITGCVRAFLWRNICNATEVIYCDTDSIVCRAASFDMGDGLGQWSVEGEFSGGGIGGRKLYAFEKPDGTYKTASKGVRLKAKEIIDICNGTPVTYYPPNPTYSIHNFPKFTPRTARMKPLVIYY